MVNILLVEDDSAIADIITFYLSKEPDYCLYWAPQASTAFQFMRDLPIDLVLMDIMLPDANGMDLCYQFRQITYCPILFISCLDDESTIVRALQLGGDDYLVKPFSGDILTAKIRTHLRRLHYDREQKNVPVSMDGNLVLTAGKLTLKSNRHELTKDGKLVKTSPTELEIMLYLMTHRNRVITQEELYQAIWKHPSYGDLRTISVHISNLRKKLEDDLANPQYIKTVRSAGYLFDVE
jgi:DNA-binding response OmpR family regulator